MVYNYIVKYAIATVKYVFAHVLPLTLIAALPAAGIAALLEPNGFGLLASWSLGEATTFADVFFLIFNRDVVTVYPYLFPVVLLAMAASVSYILGVTDKHFRVGKFSLRSPVALINDCFLPTGLTLLVLSVVYLLAKFLLVCVLSLFSLILKSLGVPFMAMGFLLTLLTVAYVVFAITQIVPVMYTSTTMLVYGYSVGDAFGVALKLGSKEKRRDVDFGLVGAFVLYAVLVAVLDVVPLSPAIALPITAVLTALLIEYCCVFVMLSFFDMSEIERRDEAKKGYEE